MISLARLTTLRSEKSFDKFIEQNHSVVIVYNYLCPACERYLEDLKPRMNKFDHIPIGRIHINFDWIIKQAKMIGDVEPENTFLVHRYGLGDMVPSTILFKKGELIERVDGALRSEALKELINKTFPAETSAK